MSKEITIENIMASQEGRKIPISAADQGGGDGPETAEKVNDLNTSTPIQEAEKTAKLTPGIATKNIENESFNSLLAYDSDSSSSSLSASEIHELGLNWQVRNDSDDEDDVIEESEDDEDEEEEEESSEESEDDSPNEEPSVNLSNKGAIKKDKPVLKVPGELSLDELPPVPDLSTLSISVDDDNFIHMGSVLGIVDKLVTVAAIPNTPAYDLDTLLFLDNGKKPLGFVFDVLGQVTSPIYAVRFNSVEDIKNLNVEIGVKVYSAPMSKHTSYVFLQQLLKMKGSDASWLGDNEVPSEFADFSDDENECYRRRGGGAKRPQSYANAAKRAHSGGDDSYKQFETTMNKRNILNTKFNKYMDSYKQSKFNRPTRARRDPPGFGTSASVPAFDPTVPPPNVRPYLSFYPPSGGMHYLPPELLGFGGMDYVDGSSASTSAGSGGENNNTAAEFCPRVLINTIRQHTNSANYFTNHAAGNNHPGPSTHE